MVLAAIDSALAQTVRDLEIIVVDNGSTDNTERAVLSISDCRVRYIRIEPTGGPAGPRNEGIQNANGEWVAFLDSDDQWFPSKLQEVLESINKTRSDLVTHYQELVDLSGLRVGVMGPRLEGEISYLNLLRTENTFATSSVVLRRSFLLENELEFNCTPQYRAVEDYDLWLRVLRLGGIAVILTKILGRNVEVRDHLGGGDLFFENMQHLIRDHSGWLRRCGLRTAPSEKELLAGLFVRRAMEQFRKVKTKDALILLLKGLAQSRFGFYSYFFFRIKQRLFIPDPR